MSEKRVAVIGAGVSGLVAADRLARAHRVSLFEAEPRPGGHSHTVLLEGSREPSALDIGFIVFNPGSYPRFTALLEELGVPSQASDMSFSVRCDRADLEWAGADSLHRVFGQRKNLVRPRFYRMLRDIARFAGAARALLEDPDERRTVSEFVHDNRYSQAFVDHYLLPLGASLWSCPAEIFAEFPVRFVAEFLASHAMLDPLGKRPQWRTVQGRARRYVDALLARFRGDLRLGVPIRAVRRGGDGITLVRADGEAEAFDEVVLACHADQALDLLERPTPVEREVLSAFPYGVNEAVLHTDTSVLPRNRRTWAAWNYRCPSRAGEGVTVTYNLNLLQGIPGPSVYCLTLNDAGLVAAERVIGRYRFRHPRFTAGWNRAQARHGELIRARRTSFCGAYWGFGFHEDGVRSALAVARAYSPALEEPI